MTHIMDYRISPTYRWESVCLHVPFSHFKRPSLDPCFWHPPVVRVCAIHASNTVCRITEQDQTHCSIVFSKCCLEINKLIEKRPTYCRKPLCGEIPFDYVEGTPLGTGVGHPPAGGVGVVGSHHGTVRRVTEENQTSSSVILCVLSLNVVR